MVRIVEQTENLDRVNVSVGKSSYDIYIGDVLGKLTDFVGASKYRAVRVLTDENVMAAGHLETTLGALRASGKKVSHGVLRAGEQFKHIRYYPEMMGKVDDPALDRKTLIIALGGGALGDEVGFVGATYLRGVDVAQMPTTPLSGADSSIGGKVGVDTDVGKNRVGAIIQPVAVFQHIPFFESFRNSPNRHYGYDSGWAETAKHAGISDALHPDLNSREVFFNLLERTADKIVEFDYETIRGAMLRNALVKGTVVEIDEKETGSRVGLNFGHTLGHPLETYMNRIFLARDSSGATVYPHGDAVGIGAHFVGRLSILQRTGLTTEEVERQRILYERLGVETRLPQEARSEEAFEEIFRIMAGDKKAISGVPQFVLQKRIGELQQTGDKQPDGSEAKGGYFLQPVSKEVLREAFEMIK